MGMARCGEEVNGRVYDCGQCHSGWSCMRAPAIERLMRDARVGAIGGGGTATMLEETAKRQ